MPAVMSRHVPICKWLPAVERDRGTYLRMAHTPFRGAGKLSGKSKREYSPGASGMAKIMLCCFHCKRSSIPSSLYNS